VPLKELAKTVIILAGEIKESVFVTSLWVVPGGIGAIGSQSLELTVLI
jgi:hypothetical protein